MKETTVSTKLDFLSGGGEMGKVIRSKDWSKTPLGSMDTWPQSLRTTVSLCIASSFPISIAWGHNRVQIYNDGYWPITGDMHPTAMGQDFKECWLSAWPVIGQAFEEASLGETRFLENQRIFLDRYGYKEETFFTFSFSPILDETGGVGGLFHPVIEMTQQILAERRLNILHILSNYTVNNRNVEEASALILECLKGFELDLPFVLLYSIADDGKEANLEGCVGIERNSSLASAKVTLGEHSLNNWPFSEVIPNEKGVQVNELSKRFGAFNCGPYSEPPEQAVVFPIVLRGTYKNNYLLVTGLSARRKLDEKYLLFYELLTASVTTVLTKARAYEEERKKAEALAEIDKAKTIFFSNISHEFRTPLTLILSPLEDLLGKEQNNFSESEKQNLETTHRNAIRLLKLVNTLLDFSRVESGRQQGVFGLADIVSLTKNLAANFHSVIDKAGLELIVKADSNIQPVYVDKEIWEKIVFNLLSNAFKYTLQGKITVELSAEKDFAVMKVHDTGVGIPENELPKMFERFHRVQNLSGRTYEGTGIGLSLIKELVQLHGGTIGVESKINEGSVFTVKIPFGKAHLNEEHIDKSEIDAYAISASFYIDEAQALLDAEKSERENLLLNQHKPELPTILVVDDNADMRLHLRSILSSNFNVITANSGTDALRKMTEVIPALVLSDIMMPVMDGIGLLKEIKSNKSTANIPVIFLTARAGEESRIEGLETGADDYLVKPFSAKELVARVKAQIKIVNFRESLKGNVRNLFMEAPAAIGVLRGPQHVFELANAMYLQLIGKRDIIGKPLREALPELEGQGFFEIFDTVYNTGKPFIGNEVPSMLDRGNGKLEEVYFNYVNQPSHNSDGEIDGLLIYGIDVTAQVLARKKIEESEKQQAFLLKLSDALRLSRNPVDIEEAVTKLALDYMGADWCHYCTIEGDHLIINRDAVRGDLPSVAGMYLISSYTLFKNLLDKRHPFIVDDVHNTDILDEKLKQLCIKLQNISFINIPVNKNGKSVGMLSLVQSKPRKWTESEVQLTRETAERAWAAVERAKAEQALQQSEEKYRTLFTSIDQGFVLCELVRNKEGKGIDYYMLELNPSYEKQTGLSKETVLGKTILQVFPTMDQRLIETYAAVVENQLPAVFEYYFEFNHSWHEIKICPGEKDKFVVLFSDITLRKEAEEKIKESEYRFRTMADASPLLIWTLDANGLSSYYNKTFLDFIGVSSEEDIPDWKKIVHPEDTQSTFNTINTAIAERRSYTLEYRLLRADGNWRWFIAQGNPITAANNDFLGFIGSSVDITERIQAEAQIKESEERFRIIADLTPNMVWAINSDGSIQYVNTYTLDYFGKTAENFPSDWSEVIHPDDIEFVMTSIQQAFAKSASYQIELRLKRHDGAYRYFLANSASVNLPDGTLYSIGTSVDINDMREAQLSLSESESRFRTLAEKLPQMVWVMNADGTMEYGSNNWKEYSGIDGVSEAWSYMMHPEDSERLIAYRNQMFAGTEGYQHEVRLKNKGGIYHWFYSVGQPVMGVDGKVNKWVGSLTDIHEQKSFTEKLEATVAERTQELQRSNEDLQQFAHVASHDLKEPVRKVKTFANRLQQHGKLDETGNRFLERIQSATDRMYSMIDGVLAYSIIDANDQSFQKVNLNEIMQHIETDLEVAFQKTGATINYGDLPIIEGLSVLLYQLFYNLINNSIKFAKTGEAPYINIMSEFVESQGKTFVKLTLSDNGIGFEKEHATVIFDTFTRLHSKDKYEGTGLGLALCKKIVERHGGTITASGTSDGASFTITIPVEQKR